MERNRVILVVAITVFLGAMVIYGAMNYASSNNGVYSRSGHEVLEGYLLSPGDLRALADKLNFTILLPTYIPDDIELKTILASESYSNGKLTRLTISLLYSDSEILGDIHPRMRRMGAYGKEMPYIRVEMPESMAREIREKIRLRIVIRVFFTEKHVEDIREGMDQLIAQKCEPASTEFYGALEKRGVVDVLIGDVYGEPACIYISHKAGTFTINGKSTIIIPSKGVGTVFVHGNGAYTIASNYPYEETMKILGSFRPWR